jgi:steroid delta-isomerase-like uncharacterized protein
MSIESNKAVIRRYLDEVAHGRNLDAIDDMIAADAVWHHPDQDVHGAAGFKAFMAAIFDGFPDIHWTVEHEIGEGDFVVHHWTARGTHTGAFMGVPPTGRSMRQGGIAIWRVVDGTVVEKWEHYDALGAFQQLGLLPAAE